MPKNTGKSRRGSSLVKKTLNSLQPWKKRYEISDEAFSALSTILVGGHAPSELGPYTRVNRAQTSSKEVIRTDNCASIACAPCWTKRKKCTMSGSSTLCDACMKQSRPEHVCIKVRFADDRVFSKWDEVEYKTKLTWGSLEWYGCVEKMKLWHEHCGPKLEVECREFLATLPAQQLIFQKGENGWCAIATTAFGLADPKIDLNQYVGDHLAWYLEHSPLDLGCGGLLLNAMKPFKEDRLVQLTLRLWVSNRLLIKGWKTAEERFRSPFVDDPHASNDTLPVPRVLQNQLDSMLENYIVRTESLALREVQSVMYKRRKIEWQALILAVSMILHVLERDTWRLMYWTQHNQALNTWRHPTKPNILIEKNYHFANLLLVHLRYLGRAQELAKNTMQLALPATPEKACESFNGTDEESLDTVFSDLTFTEAGFTDACQCGVEFWPNSISSSSSGQTESLRSS